MIWVIAKIHAWCDIHLLLTMLNVMGFLEARGLVEPKVNGGHEIVRQMRTELKRRTIC